MKQPVKPTCSCYKKQKKKKFFSDTKIMKRDKKTRVKLKIYKISKTNPYYIKIKRSKIPPKNLSTKSS